MQFSKTLEAINNAELDENQRLSILEALKEDVNDEEKKKRKRCSNYFRFS
ncbi:hypothetical protein [Staphylococcus aureus]|nr:hypothetical protein [Staphylococcus aureus]